MQQCIAVLVLLLSTTACDRPSSLTGPSSVPQSSTPPPPPPVAVSVRDVTLGERVEGVFGDGKTISPMEHHFVVTVPRDGTLTVALTWDPWLVGTLLKLTLAGRTFLPVPPNWSPVVGRLPVEAGKRYLMVVGLGGADWLPHDLFVLTTGLEP